MADILMRTFLRFGGYELEGLTTKERRTRESQVESDPPGLGLSKTPRGGIHLFFNYEKRQDSINLNKFALKLTKAQLAAVCEHIAPELGWDLT